MAIKNKLTEDFLEGLKELETILIDLGFTPFSSEQKGFASYVEYKKGKTIVEFMLGPTDWDVEMIIFTQKKKFVFKDLLEIPSIRQWVDNNRYIQEGERNVKKELFWYMELLRISLPIIE